MVIFHVKGIKSWARKNSIFIRLHNPNCQTESTNIDEPLCLAGSCQLVGCGWRMCVEEERNGENSAEEEKNDPAFAKELASLCELYVNDAFGSAHRAHASTEGITHYVEKSAAGLLMQKELEYLGKATSHPPASIRVSHSCISSVPVP